MDRTGWDDSRSPSQFTPNSEESFYAVVDSPDFFRQDAQLIYQALREQLRPISFGEYLQRYIYRKAGFSEPFEEVPLSEYQRIIVESFADGGVPSSFDGGSVRVRTAARNWLTQQTVYREAVLLLGFGLRMRLADVEELLIKGLQEPRLSWADPKEALCAYCFAHGLGYHKYADLFRVCQERAGALEKEPSPSALPAVSEAMQREETLLTYVSHLMKKQDVSRQDQEARSQFLQLYLQAQQVTAAALNDMNQDAASLQARKMQTRLANSDQFFDYQKQEWIQDVRNAAQVRTPEEIMPADIEMVMQASIPRDRHGNLLPMKKSTLNRQFRNRRMTRQRLEDLLAGETAVTRYDLIMLCFYVDAHQKAGDRSRLQIYRSFLERTNRILQSCGMGPLYTANPFECFLLMCQLSDDPMGTYADVVEKSYQEAVQ